MAISVGKSSFVTNNLVLYLDAAHPINYTLSEVEVLVVGGGGGGGMDMGGGGGGGGVLYNTSYPVTPGSGINVIVGNGGAGAPAAGTNGQPTGHQYTIRAQNGQSSSFGNMTALGGGYGGSSVYTFTPDNGYGGGGASGGGASGYANDGTGNGAAHGRGGRFGLGTIGQGNNGGGGSGQYNSGGGGGAGQPGGSGAFNWAPKGGDGLPYSILGKVYYWGGGGGGAGYSFFGGHGGLGGGGGGAVGTTYGGVGYNNGSPGGGGGTGTWANTPGGNGGTNTGGGGGGGAHYNSNNKGGDGGSGIVVVRYPGPQKANGGNIISDVGGYTTHIFTTSGTFTPLTAASIRSTFYGLQDLSGNNNTAVSFNGVTYNSGVGGHIVFDGSNDFLRIEDNTLFDTQTPSVEVWVKTDATTQNGFWFEKGTVNTQYSLFQEGSFIRWRHNFSDISSYTNLSATTADFMNTTNWYQIVGTYSNGNRRIYINGSLVSSDTQTGVIQTNSSGCSIGAYGGYSGGRSYFYDGNLAIIRVYNRELSASEVLQNFNSTRSRFGI